MRRQDRTPWDSMQLEDVYVGNQRARHHETPSGLGEMF